MEERISPKIVIKTVPYLPQPQKALQKALKQSQILPRQSPCIDPYPPCPFPPPNPARPPAKTFPLPPEQIHPTATPKQVPEPVHNPQRHNPSPVQGGLMAD